MTFTLQAYVAITASSWQLGAALSIVAELGPVDIDGGLHFDAIAYDDGRFSVELGGHVRIRWRGHTLMSVELEIVARPQRSAGLARRRRRPRSPSCGGTRRSTSSTRGATSGRCRRCRPSTRRRSVRAALAEPASWSTQLPAGGESLVTLAGAPATGVLAHPLGTLTVVAAGRSARAAPRPRRRPPGGARHRRRDRRRPRRCGAAGRRRHRRWSRSRGRGSRTSPRTNG